MIRKRLGKNCNDKEKIEEKCGISNTERSFTTVYLSFQKIRFC
jgi:hypothetical protein